MSALLIMAGGTAVSPLVFQLAIFVMAIFVGYYVVWSVTPALHTPLMAVTNAISSVIIVGALVAVAAGVKGGSGISTWTGFAAVALCVAAILYTVSAVLFILALRGLSSPETSRRGNTFGMIGIAIAIVTTLLVAGMNGMGLVLSAGGLAIGGIIGAIIAKKIPMTDMPQLVAAF